MIQLRKFAEAVKRIKAAVSPDATPGQRPPPRATGPRAVLSADVSDMLRTELSGLDPSVGGAARNVMRVLLLELSRPALAWLAVAPALVCVFCLSGECIRFITLCMT